MQITFIADTQADLETKIKAFLADSAIQTEFGARRPLPSWAPEGSKWVLLPGAPALEGPDGQPIAIEWVGSVPTKGVPHVNPNDPTADAQTAALLASIRGG